MRAVTQLTDFSPLAFGFPEQQKNCSLSVCEAVDPRDISALKSLLKRSCCPWILGELWQRYLVLYSYRGCLSLTLGKVMPSVSGATPNDWWSPRPMGCRALEGAEELAKMWRYLLYHPPVEGEEAWGKGGRVIDMEGVGWQKDRQPFPPTQNKTEHVWEKCQLPLCGCGWAGMLAPCEWPIEDQDFHGWGFWVSDCPSSPLHS